MRYLLAHLPLAGDGVGMVAAKHPNPTVGTAELSAGDPHPLERKLGPFTQGKGKPEACGSAGEQPGLERSQGRCAPRSGEATSSCSGSGAGAQRRKWRGAGCWRGSPSAAAEGREVRSGCKTPGGLAARNTRRCQVCGRAARLGFLFQVLLLL